MKLSTPLLSLAAIAAAGVLFVLAERARAQSGGVFGSGPIPANNQSQTVSYSTWANSPTGHINLQLTPQQAVLNTDAAVTGFDNAAVAGQENSCILWATNNAASNITLRVTAAGYTDVGSGARSYVISNGTHRVIAFNKNDMGFHGQSQLSY